MPSSPGTLSKIRQTISDWYLVYELRTSLYTLEPWEKALFSELSYSVHRGNFMISFVINMFTPTHVLILLHIVRYACCRPSQIHSSWHSCLWDVTLLMCSFLDTHSRFSTTWTLCELRILTQTQTNIWTPTKCTSFDTQKFTVVSGNTFLDIQHEEHNCIIDSLQYKRH